MIDWNAMLGAFNLMATSAGSWGWIVPGLIVGLIFGAVPGVSITTAMAIVLPLSLYMEFFPAIVFLTSVYTGAGFGGSIPAILMKIPGTPSSYATTFDGYAMSRKGLHNEALGAALFASTLGGLFGFIVLLLVVEPIADVVLKIGPVEMLAIVVWGLLLLGSLGTQRASRGLLAAAIGVLLGSIGMNTAGYIRGTLGSPELLDGISLVPAMIGLLASGQLLTMVTQDYILDAEGSRVVSLRRILDGCRTALKHPGVMLRGSMIGIIVGAAPGVGPAVGNLIAYAEAKRTAKDGATFGTGNPKGVIAAESSVASSEGGSIAPMLALGIPGSGATAVLMAAFMMHNIVPGPNFIQYHKDMVYAIILNNIVQGMLLLVVGIAFIYVACTIVKVRTRYVLPVILVIATLGTYAVDGSIVGPITLVVFSALGFALVKFEYSVAAVVIGLMLGRMLETEFLRSYQLSGGDPLFILERPGAMVIVAVMILSLVLTAISKRRQSRVESEFNSALQAQELVDKTLASGKG